MLLRYSSKLATVEDLSFFLIRRVGTVATVCCILIYRIWHAYPTHISLHLATPTIIIAMRTFFSFRFVILFLTIHNSIVKLFITIQ